MQLSVKIVKIVSTALRHVLASPLLLTNTGTKFPSGVFSF